VCVCALYVCIVFEGSVCLHVSVYALRVSYPMAVCVGVCVCPSYLWLMAVCGWGQVGGHVPMSTLPSLSLLDSLSLLPL